MKSTFARKVIPGVFLCCVLTSCGGSSSNTPGTLHIQLSPTSPTLAVNSSIAISAQTTPTLPVNDPTYDGWMNWSIVGESQDQCTQTLPNPQCPNGTLEWHIPIRSAPMEVTYYAPATPGSYQVSVQGSIYDMSNPNKIEYQGTATVTVTVTAQ